MKVFYLILVPACRNIYLAAVLCLAPHAGAAIRVVEDAGRVRVTWPISAQETGSAVFSMDESKPLILKGKMKNSPGPGK